MKVIIPIEILPIDGNGSHIFLRCRINGKPARFLVDTGASMSVVDQERIGTYFLPEKATLNKVEALSRGFGSNQIECSTLTLRSISFGRLVLKKVEMVAVDFSHINESYDILRMKKILGVVGGDLLMLLHAVIDYRRHRITFQL